AEALALTVRQFDDLLEDRALADFQARAALFRITQLAAQPFLDQRVLPVVFIIADEPGETIGELPGATPGIALGVGARGAAGGDVLVKRRQFRPPGLL